MSFRPKSNSADWLSWVMQAIVGLVVGALAGLTLASRGRAGGWRIDESLLLPFILGTALMGAALASHYGDRLWIGDNYRVIAPDGVQHSRSSQFLTFFLGILGLILTLSAILRQVGVL
jgi:ABC-type sulfate transport system permease component